MKDERSRPGIMLRLEGWARGMMPRLQGRLARKGEEAGVGARYIVPLQVSLPLLWNAVATRARRFLPPFILHPSSLILSLTLFLASAIGVLAFIYPFFAPATVTQSPVQSMAHAQDAPLLTVALIVLCLGTVLTTLGSGAMNSKMVAILGVLTAANAVMRAVPGPAGFAAVFMLPILCGYAYGATFGFLLGALSLLVSAIIGAGVGPWLPYQMFATGWVGLTSGWLPKLRRWPRAEVVMLGGWGLVWGFLFGVIMNIWFWPFVFQAPQAEMYWQPGMRLREAVRHYAVFYLATSVWWDLGRAAGNALLTWMFGAAILKLLRRFQARFRFTLVAE
jgi:energy-coupling factor transport system substrate-specific component